MVHQIRAGAEVLYLVCRPRCGPDHRRHRLLWFPTGQKPNFLGLEDHVHRTWASHYYHRLHHILLLARYSNEGTLFVRAGKGHAAEACIRQPDGNPQQALQTVSSARNSPGHPAMVDGSPHNPRKSPLLQNHASRTRSDFGIDFDIQRCDYDVLGHAHPEFWLQAADGRPLEHAFRHRVHCKHFHRRVWNPAHIASLGVARCLLYTRYTWRCPDVLCDGYEGRPACRNLPRQLHHSHADCDLSMDGFECWRANQAGDQCRTRIWKLQRRQHNRPANLSVGSITNPELKKLC